MPGPNLEPVKAILNGCPTPLKLVLFDLISLLTICSKFSLLKTLSSKIFSSNNRIIFFASSFIKVLSFSLKITLSISH